MEIVTTKSSEQVGVVVTVACGQNDIGIVQAMVTRAKKQRRSPKLF